MLWELDEDIRETLAKCSQFRLLGHRQRTRTQCGQSISSDCDAWLTSDCRASNDLLLVLKNLAGPAPRSRRGPQYGHVPGRQAHEVVFILPRLEEQAVGHLLPESWKDGH